MSEFPKIIGRRVKKGSEELCEVSECGEVIMIKRSCFKKAGLITRYSTLGTLSNNTIPGNSSMIHDKANVL